MRFQIDQLKNYFLLKSIIQIKRSKIESQSQAKSQIKGQAGKENG